MTKFFNDELHTLSTRLSEARAKLVDAAEALQTTEAAYKDATTTWTALENARATHASLTAQIELLSSDLVKALSGAVKRNSPQLREAETMDRQHAQQRQAAALPHIERAITEMRAACEAYEAPATGVAGLRAELLELVAPLGKSESRPFRMAFVGQMGAAQAHEPRALNLAINTLVPLLPR